jgi:hypothetical protein
MMLLGLLTVGYAAVFLIRSLVVGVIADADGLTIRRLWRRRQVRWSSVGAVRVYETVPERWSASYGPDRVTWRMRSVASWSVGVVELVDGTSVRLPGFRAASRGDGLSLGLPTVTELKVQALHRYMACMTGRRSDLPTASPIRIEDPTSSRWDIVWYLVAAAALWLVASWAAGTLVSPVMLVVGAVFSLYQLSTRRRVG